ncbi:hypothetical protein [Sphingorhabdus sp.]|uniref:hypothetical protein n=1 Tax=Sphingorhabdus sp. TaxID=1902408 RepID=UPI003340BE58
MKKVFASAFVLGCLVAWAANARADGPVYVERYTSPAPMSTVRSYNPAPSNSTAQGVAELMARSGSCQHFGGNRGYEGVGMSSAGPDAALNSCCYSRSGMRVVDQGVAHRNGRWYACKRYAR